MKNINNFISEKKIVMTSKSTNFGIISEIKDGCAIIKGLKKAQIGEKLILVKTKGIANILSINANGDVYALIFTEIHSVAQNELVFKTDELLNMSITRNILGRFLKPL